MNISMDFSWSCQLIICSLYFYFFFSLLFLKTRSHNDSMCEQKNCLIFCTFHYHTHHTTSWQKHSHALNVLQCDWDRSINWYEFRRKTNHQRLITKSIPMRTKHRIYFQVKRIKWIVENPFFFSFQEHFIL